MRERHNRGCNAGAEPLLLEDRSTFFRICFILTVVRNESGDNISGARKTGDSRKGVRDVAVLQRRGPRSSRFAKKESAEYKVW